MPDSVTAADKQLDDDHSECDVVVDPEDNDFACTNQGGCVSYSHERHCI